MKSPLLRPRQARRRPWTCERQDFLDEGSAGPDRAHGPGIPADRPLHTRIPAPSPRGAAGRFEV